jgi:hypothetical protein
MNRAQPSGRSALHVLFMSGADFPHVYLVFLASGYVARSDCRAKSQYED